MKNNETFIIPKPFWTLDHEYQFSKIRIAPSSQAILDQESGKTIFDDLFSKESTIIFNFDDSKDRRRPSTKDNDPVHFSMSDFTSKQISCNFIFNQDTESKTIFSVFVDDSNKNQLKSQSNSFNWNGKFKDFKWYSNDFEKLNILQNQSVLSKADDTDWFCQRPITISSNSLKEVDINSDAVSLEISSTSLENLKASCSKSFELKIGDSTGSSKIKKIDLFNCPGEVSINFNYEFILDSMNFNYSAKGDGMDKQKNTTSQLTYLFSQYNKDCKIILNPEADFSCSRFMYSRDAKKAKTLFKQFLTNKDGHQQIEITLLDLILALYDYKKKSVIVALTQQEKTLKKYALKHQNRPVSPELDYNDQDAKTSSKLAEQNPSNSKKL